MAKRIPVIAGNWKMNNTAAETKALLAELAPLVKDARCEVVVCVPFTDLAAAAKAIRGTKIRLGAQNVSWAEKGAYTGEISADMLTEAKVKYVIIGHSERRQYFGETDDSVNKRTLTALKKGLIPIVCVGELEAERDAGITDEVTKRQLTGAFKDISAADARKVIVAYEPVWAIGTGKTATSADADKAIGAIRKTLKGLYGKATSDKVRIQYGGSMNAANCAELMAMPEIDGGLIGGASLKAKDFAIIVSSGNNGIAQ
jgi:triosephosphate isomerase